MPPDRHASRASFACARCKKDKRRCDISQFLGENGRPERPCSSCKKKNEKCEVRYGEDKRSNRRPSESKALHHRMQALEDFVRNASRADGAAFGSCKESDSDGLESLFRATSRPVEDAHSSMGLAFPSPANSWSPGNQARIASVTPHERRSDWSATPQNEPTPNSIRSESFSSEHIPEFDDTPEQFRFPPAMDALFLGGGDANLDQYLGHASMFPYLENPRKASVSPNSGRRCHTSQETHPEPEPIVAYLLDLFWQWQSSHLFVVDRGIFLRHRKAWDDSGGQTDGDFYSPCLLYAIMALASMISPDKGVSRYSASSDEVPGESFARRARAMVELEMAYPSLATVQAALILGCRYGAMENTSLGWAYSGIAFRIASDLGLHLDCSQAVACGRMTSETAELRRRVFWACYQEDTFLSIARGRQTTFRDCDVTVSAPNRTSDHLPRTESEFPLRLFHASSALSILLSRIQNEIYGRRLRDSAGKLRSTACHMHDELWRWHQTLPQNLKIADNNQAATPQVILLHMTFYFALIYLHRPSLQLSRVSQELPNQRQPIDSTALCFKAATEIMQLALTYRRSYNTRQLPPFVLHFIFLAGTVHLINCRLSKNDRHDSLLRSSTEVLLEMSKSYPLSRKAEKVLRDMTVNWECPSVIESRRASRAYGSLTPKSMQSDEKIQHLDLQIASPALQQQTIGVHNTTITQNCELDLSTPDTLQSIGLYDPSGLDEGGDSFGLSEPGMEWLSEHELFEAVNDNSYPLSYTELQST